MIKRALFLLSVVLGNYLYGQAAVTYELSSGRFGDNLLNYIHAKWISYAYDIPLLYKPFEGSEELVLHHLEKHWTPEEEKNFDQVIFYQNGEKIRQDPISKLYIVRYFPECPSDLSKRGDWPVFPIDWKDEGFLSVLKETIQPIQPVSLCEMPKNTVNIALHVRTGRGHDEPSAFDYWPLKFPPQSYYLNCLGSLCKIYQNRPIYVMLFTDDPEPKQILEAYKKKFSNHNIHFDYKRRGSPVEDFFSMTQFDGLIRSTSNYTFALPLISNYKFVMKPVHYIREKGQIQVDRTHLILDGKEFTIKMKAKKSS